MGFPEGFLFGTANADHQVEAHDPAREDVWDVWERTQGLTPRGRATDFWNRYEEDIANAAAMGMKVFRFSIAWARVERREGEFDAEALAHYRKVAECVKSHGMEVMVTLHHFVWPVWLERDYGGMIGEEFPDLFARYAEKVAEGMGDLVDWWITFNEPSQLTFGYIKPWWQNRYFMPPGLPQGSSVDAEAAAVAAKLGLKVTVLEIVNNKERKKEIVLEELVVIDVGVEQRRVETQAPVHQLGLDTQLGVGGDLLVVGVVDHQLCVHQFTRPARAGVEPEVQQVPAAQGIEAAAAEALGGGGIERALWGIAPQQVQPRRRRAEVRTVVVDRRRRSWRREVRGQLGADVLCLLLERAQAAGQ